MSYIHLQSKEQKDFFEYQGEERKRIFSVKFFIFGILVILFGVGSGYLLAKNFSPSKKISQTSVGETPEGKLIVGIENKQIFPDSAEGEIQAGGIDGEGTHKLIRPGGESQTVYLTSSVLDLSQFEGKKVRVWGETRAAQKAGWLMDVGKVEVL